ncbi:MAG: hypothetical protein EXR47_06635 [Dehalococcoidia bacterium]|nr:hypothetical protein [Dehalococcoidia bacterium]
MVYTVEYRPAMSPLWIWAAVASWVGVILANGVVGLYAESTIWLVTAIVAGLGWVFLTLLFIQVTRRSRTGTAETDGRSVVVRETGSWWRRVSLRGRLSMIASHVEDLKDGRVLATCQDPVWGMINVVFQASSPEEAHALMSQLQGEHFR